MRLGELCAGYGGLGMAVEEVFNAETAWFSEFDAAPSKILAHHWPGVPNYGDMTAIDWAAIEPVDIISGGTPCQDLSAAGKRRGMTEGTRSNLWVNMREAIAIQRPKYVVWENVRGAYSATATSDLEQCPGCLGDTPDGGAFLRALGRVLGDLSDLGYDAQWRGLRAADVGAPHGRFRVFVLAANRDHLGKHGSGERAEQDGRRQPSNSSGTTPQPASIGRRKGRAEHAGQQGRLDAVKRSASPTAHTGSIGRQRGRASAVDGCACEGRQTDALHGHPAPTGTTQWGVYGPSIHRWERVNGPAPRPTERTGRNRGERLSPRFAEWMMGVPAGWITSPEIGISRNDQLKACGNGVVPQQAIAALEDMLATFRKV